MTDYRPPVAAIAGGLFCLILIYLALQLRAGNDPAIGAGTQTPTAQGPRKVLVRRVIVRRIVAGDAPPAPAPAAPPAPAPEPVVSRGS